MIKKLYPYSFVRDPCGFLTGLFKDWFIVCPYGVLIVSKIYLKCICMIVICN
jgi:hypothetical protein